jgi:7-cyano-7-deazaguanine synthase
MNKQAVLSLSGGMDSSTLLLHLLANGYEVTALSFDYGQKHNVELERAKDLVSYINQKGQNIKHQVIKLDGSISIIKFSISNWG